MQLLATPFSGVQLALIIIVASVCALLFAGNAALIFLFYRRNKRRKLCNSALQQRREELLEELYKLRSGAEAEALDDEEEEEDDDVVSAVGDESVFSDTDEDEADETDGADVDGLDGVEAGGEALQTASAFNAEILAVKDMSALMRERFGLEGAEYDRKRYFVRSSYSFEAKLRLSSEEVKQRYRQIVCDFGGYMRVNFKTSFRRERVYIGRKTIALIFFRGKKLCVSLALNPADYENTKYRGENVSDIKRFANTPMLIRVTSGRRLEYVKYLISVLAGLNGVTEISKSDGSEIDLSKKSRNDLFAENNLKIALLGEAPELDGWDDGAEEEAVSEDAPVFRAGILAVSDMSAEMREKFGLTGSGFDGKKYYVRYSYGFEAKLRSSRQEIKDRYISFMEEAGLYKKLNVSGSFRNKRFSYRRKTVGIMFFKGKTLCVSFALNPKDYENTKYRGEDVSDKKRFAATPLLIKLTSARRLGYAMYLLNRLAEERLIELNTVSVPREYDLETLSRNELFAENLIKINVIGEVKDEAANK